MATNNDDQISVSISSLQDVKKSVSNLLESLEDSLSSTTKSLMYAEDAGWNDKSYARINAKFLEVSQKMKDAIKTCEDELLPDIKRIERLFDE